MRTEYVCGFAFAQDNDQVVLIRKNKPAWQAGRLNGVGGKIKLAEPPNEAMEREFFEETGVRVPRHLWSHFADLIGFEFKVMFYTVEVEWNILRQVRTMESEHVITTSMYAVNAMNAVPNVTWLLPMARNLSKDISGHKVKMLEVYYEKD